jgi:ribose-phosphate pyrophosphokinase
VERARAFDKHLNAPLAIIDKRRTEVNVAEVMHIIGDVEGRHCLIVDDLIDTGGTLVKAAEALMKQGALSVTACATHAVLSGPAVERISSSDIQQVIVTNSSVAGRRYEVPESRCSPWRLCSRAHTSIHGRIGQYPVHLKQYQPGLAARAGACEGLP